MAQYNTDTSYVPKGSPTNLDSLDWDSLDYNDLSQKQMKALQSLGGVGTKWAAPGTSGYTGSDIQAAGDIAEEAPTSLETGYGPQEQNPQQAYQTRFQQRSGTGEGYDAPTEYEGLSSQIGIGNYLQGRSATDYGAGEGAASGGYDLGDPTLGQTAARAAGLTGPSFAAGIASPFASSALQGGYMSSQLGYGIAPGVGYGLKSALTSPLGMVGILDSALGEGIRQGSLDEGFSDRGLTQEDAKRTGSAAETGNVSGMTPGELRGLEALDVYSGTPHRATAQGLQAFGGLLGFGGEGRSGIFGDEASLGRDLSSEISGEVAGATPMSLSESRALDMAMSSPNVDPTELGFGGALSQVGLERMGATHARGVTQAEQALADQLAEKQAQRGAIEAAMADTFGTSVTGLESTFGDPFGIMGSTWGGGGIAGGTSRGDIGSGFGPSAAADVDREEGRGGSRGGGMGDIGF